MGGLAKLKRTKWDRTLKDWERQQGQRVAADVLASCCLFRPALRPGLLAGGACPAPVALAAEGLPGSRAAIWLQV